MKIFVINYLLIDLYSLYLFLTVNLVSVQVLDQYHNHLHYHIHDQYRYLKVLTSKLMVIDEIVFEFEAKRKYFINLKLYFYIA